MGRDAAAALYSGSPWGTRSGIRRCMRGIPGSAAAPTAGLHFTKELMDGLASQGVERAYLTLHVGLDTFRPVTEEDPRRHQIHRELCRLEAEAAEKINACQRSGGQGSGRGDNVGAHPGAVGHLVSAAVERTK